MTYIMHNWEAESFNSIYPAIFDQVVNHGDVVCPRGKITRELSPATLTLTNPRKRFCSARDGFNLPFSCAEVLWILKGSGDADMICHYLPRFREFKDEGYPEFHGAYGTRLRRYGYDERNEFSVVRQIDQLEQVYVKLRDDRDTRQAVMVLWNPWKDNLQKSVDYPCNNWSHLMIRDGKLNWTQVLRSNDVILGLPQNIFQFTHLQEIVAGWLNVEVGRYTHFTDSLHVYMNDYYDLAKVRPHGKDIYDKAQPYSMKLPKKKFDDMLDDLADAESDWRKGTDVDVWYNNTYWDSLAGVLRAYNLMHHGKEEDALQLVDQCIFNEYRTLMFQWCLKKVKNPKTVQVANAYVKHAQDAHELL